ncbi:MAG: hypothetical protein AVDCRST_MAG19-1707 [uncultured Thermomicrobiales bacterium]|uniref:Uncharacterized protein n=1 Tax=uncultured Thermomicrobiales bacterium TaxID=1645740 RepID=A0A6J4UU32_9BACT|nr:MAG: hypothetical protein AVDCRST_MAG19-1707 [uncultured Thermomicrobiales bacterium]
MAGAGDGGAGAPAPRSPLGFGGVAALPPCIDARCDRAADDPIAGGAATVRRAVGFRDPAASTASARDATIEERRRDLEAPGAGGRGNAGRTPTA